MIDCPRALTEPPTCTGKNQTGWLRFSVSVDYDVNAVDVECVERSCTCEYTDEEWAALEDEAVRRAAEPPEWD